MATFSQLPDDMITEIWEYFMEPQDVESFALVSKRIYAIGAPFVDEHNKLKRNYSFSKTAVDVGEWGFASMLLLKKILLCPRVALYVTHLSNYRNSAGYWVPPDDDDDDDDDDHGKLYQYYIPYPDDDMGRFIEAIRRADLVPQNEVEDWIKAVKKGNDDPIVALLLLLLPNLCKMTLVIHSGFCRLAKTLKRISEAKNSPFLTRLTTVNLYFQLESDDDFMDWELLSTSATLPLLQFLLVERIGIDFEDSIKYRQCFRPGSSTEKELALARSRACPESMFHLFESFKGLKKFTYSNLNNSTEPVEPFWMGKASVTYARYSLESLKITSEWKDYAEPKTLGSFRDCTNLREMEITVDLFKGKYSSRTLPDIFPISIEKIHLHYSRIPLAIIESFVKAKSQRLHILRVLTVKLEPGTILQKETKAIITASQNKCRDVGIEFSVFVLKGPGWQEV